MPGFETGGGVTALLGFCQSSWGLWEASALEQPPQACDPGHFRICRPQALGHRVYSCKWAQGCSHVDLHFSRWDRTSTVCQTVGPGTSGTLPSSDQQLGVWWELQSSKENFGNAASFPGPGAHGSGRFVSEGPRAPGYTIPANSGFSPRCSGRGPQPSSTGVLWELGRSAASQAWP